MKDEELVYEIAYRAMLASPLTALEWLDGCIDKSDLTALFEHINDRVNRPFMDSFMADREVLLFRERFLASANL